jgi:hypothetical protein
MDLKPIKYDENKLPYFLVLFKQFPNAVRELIRRSNDGHIKYKESDEDWNNWFRVGEDKGVISYQNALLRHLFQEGEDSELDHDCAVLWNAAAILEFKLRKKMYKDDNR